MHPLFFVLKLKASLKDIECHWSWEVGSESKVWWMWLGVFVFFS